MEWKRTASAALLVGGLVAGLGADAAPSKSAPGTIGLALTSWDFALFETPEVSECSLGRLKHVQHTQERTEDDGVSAHCNRVPVLDGHTECVSVSLKKIASLPEVREALRNFEVSPELASLHLSGLWMLTAVQYRPGATGLLSAALSSPQTILTAY